MAEALRSAETLRRSWRVARAFKQLDLAARRSRMIDRLMYMREGPHDAKANQGSRKRSSSFVTPHGLAVLRPRGSRAAIRFELRAQKIVDMYAGMLPKALADLNQASELDPKETLT
jgi:hypothetical protein